MDSSGTARFRFRDHNPQAPEDDSVECHVGMDSSSISSDSNVDLELQSMTAKGIKHLCSELVELKSESDEDFQKSIFSSHSAFLRIFEEMGSMKNNLMQLKYQLLMQKKILKDLTDVSSLKFLREEMTAQSITEEPPYDHVPSPTILEIHMEETIETLDILLSEHRLDDAISLVMETDSFQQRKMLEKFSSDELMSYNSAMAEKRAAIIDQFIVIAKNPRVSIPELLKALCALRKLDETHLVTKLLLDYYRSRIASGIHDLHTIEPQFYVGYIQEAAKFVFSMISRASRSFLIVHGESFPYAPELIQWACEETEVFASCFNMYVKFSFDLSGGLSTLVEAVQVAISYCSLLEAQGIFLRSCLTKYICPCVDDIFQIQIEHFKEVISIFTSNDAWVLSRYLVSGVLSDRSSSTPIGRQPDCWLLTDSGRKFITLFQAITEDIYPLVTLEMEGSVLRGLMDLLTKYVVILEISLSSDADTEEKESLRINLAETLLQKVSVITNLSTIVQFFTSIIRIVFSDISHLKFEIDNYLLFVQDTCGRLRSQFCKQFIHKFLSHGSDGKHNALKYTGAQDVSDIYDLVPSASYQELFLELRKLQKHFEGDTVQVHWMMDLFGELMETIFEFTSSNDEMCEVTNLNKFMQSCSR